MTVQEEDPRSVEFTDKFATAVSGMKISHGKRRVVVSGDLAIMLSDDTLRRVVTMLIENAQMTSYFTPLGIHRKLSSHGGHNEVTASIKLLRVLGVLENANREAIAGANSHALVLNREKLEKFFLIR